MTLFFLIIQIILSLMLILVILVQKNNTEGLSGLASSNQPLNSGFVSKRSATNFLTKSTTILAIFFMLNSLILANLVTKQTQNNSIIIKNIEKKDQVIDSQANNPNTNSLPLAE